jgi:hypothetical protein
MAYNKKNLSLIPQALPLVLPSWSRPIYVANQQGPGTGEACEDAQEDVAAGRLRLR